MVILLGQHHYQSSSASTTANVSTSPSEEGEQQRVPGERGDGLEGIVSGFQWMKLTSPWGFSGRGGTEDNDDDDDDDGATTSCPLMDRSDHSAGSWGPGGRSRRWGGGQPYRRRHSWGDLGRHDEGEHVVAVIHNNNSYYNSYPPARYGQGSSNERRRPPRRTSGGSTASSNSVSSVDTPTNINGNTTTSNGSSSNNNGNRRSYGDYELKNSRDALEGSIAAVINYLGSAGVPKPSTDQLGRNLEMRRYFAVMKRVQDYIRCIHSDSEDEILAKVHLTVNAWEALCRLKTMEYKRAYKYAYRLRYERPTNNQNGNNHRHREYDDIPVTTASAAEIKQAIELQIKLAEQSTACQKKLYLVHRWERRVLQKLKKASTIEPQGYQPIRCL